MALIQVNAIEAAQRQIDSAIRMTFDGEDPIAIEALTAATHRLIRDDQQSRGDVDAHLRLGDWISPVHAARFWRHFSAAAEFLKQPGWNPETVFDLEEETNDFLIVFAARWFQGLGYTASREMRVFATWYVACNPGILRAEAMPDMPLTAQLEAMSKVLRDLSRADRLRAGKMALAAVKDRAAG